jgi:hypothetical protein
VLYNRDNGLWRLKEVREDIELDDSIGGGTTAVSSYTR